MVERGVSKGTFGLAMLLSFGALGFSVYSTHYAVNTTRLTETANIRLYIHT